MYQDSDDETLSGDEDEAAAAAVPERKPVVGSKRPSLPPPPPPPPHEYGSSKNRRAAAITSGGGGGGGNGDGYHYKRRKSDFNGFNICPVLVVDYDLTLVDRSSRPFPGSHRFIEKLREFNDGRNQLILYSHGSPAYIEDGLDKHYDRERKYFDEVISDSSARDNKPVSHVRRVIKSLDYLIGPYVIIDDMRSNLDGDQYDVVIDVTRMTKYGQDGRAVSVDYDSCLCVLDQGVRAFLNTKKKKSTR